MDAIETITERQGWTDLTLGGLALAFIRAGGGNEDEFVAFLQRIADTENDGEDNRG